MFGFLNLFGCVLRDRCARLACEADSLVGEPLDRCSDFFPVVLSFMRQLPVIGHFLSAPGVRQVRFFARPLHTQVAETDTASADDGPVMRRSETVARLREDYEELGGQGRTSDRITGIEACCVSACVSCVASDCIIYHFERAAAHQRERVE